MGKKFLWMLCGISAVALLCGSVSLRAQRPGPTVYVALWFDTEDYILPQSAEGAMLLKAQGLYDEALPLSERALAIKEKAFGTEHPVWSEYCADRNPCADTTLRLHRQRAGFRWIRLFPRTYLFFLW